ncbi:MAG: pentapeptide repeat-containing protein [Candidatus Aminicenantes bacterium]|nr:pentapeptide repeat-containing protein [Candidatus Aminicenantes bacterium]
MTEKIEQVKRLLDVNPNWICDKIAFLDKTKQVKYFTAREERLLDESERFTVFRFNDLLEIENPEAYSIPTKKGLIFFEGEPPVNEIKKSLEKFSKTWDVEFSLMPIDELKKKVLKVKDVEDLYKRALKVWKKSEGGDFEYIKPTVISEFDKKKDDLCKLTDEFTASVKYGVTLLYGHYGDGKSTFCRYYIFQHVKNLDTRDRIPLLFYLNEHSAGSIEQFIETRLHEYYKLYISFDEFADLCEDGHFTVFLDAFDQMLPAPDKDQIDFNFHQVRRLAKGKGKVVLTSRYSYFKRHIEGLGHGEEVINQFFLTGFPQPKIAQFAKNKPGLKALLDNDKTGKIVDFLTVEPVKGKPVLLKVVSDNVTLFEELVEKKENITVYDLLGLAYDNWNRLSFNVLKTKELRYAALHLLAREVTLHGLNRSCQFSLWFDACQRHFNLKNEDSRQLMEELASLNLLDDEKLREKKTLTFKNNPFLEYLLAYFILAELESEAAGEPVFLKDRLLNTATKNLVVSQLDNKHAARLKDITESTANKNFEDVRYLGANSVGLILSKSVTLGPDEETWKELCDNVNLENVNLRNAELRDLDLSGFSFMGANLENSDFSYTNLMNTNFSYAILKNMILQEQGELPVNSVFFTGEDGVDFFAGGTQNGVLMIWNSRTGKMERRHICSDKITALAAGRKDRSIFAASRDNNINFIDKEIEIPRSIPLNLKGIASLDVTHDNRILFAGGQNGRLGVFSFVKKETRYVDFDTTYWLVALVVLPGANHLLTGHFDGTIAKIDLRDFTVKTIAKIPEGIKKILLLNENQAVVHTGNGKIIILNIETGENKMMRSHPGYTEIALAAGIGELFTLQDKIIRFGKIEAFLKKDRKTLNSVACKEIPNTITVSLDGNYIGAGGKWLEIFKKDPKTGRYKTEYSEEMRMNCRGLNFYRSKGVDLKRFIFFLERGAMVPPDDFLNEYFDVKFNRFIREEKSFVCTECERTAFFSEGFDISESKLVCNTCNRGT